MDFLSVAIDGYYMYKFTKGKKKPRNSQNVVVFWVRVIYFLYSECKSTGSYIVIKLLKRNLFFSLSDSQ